MTWFEPLDMVADQRHPDTFTHKMYFIFWMHVPDIALPRVIIEPPKKGVASVDHNLLYNRDCNSELFPHDFP
jgi:hypothetical protein